MVDGAFYAQNCYAQKRYYWVRDQEKMKSNELVFTTVVIDVLGIYDTKMRANYIAYASAFQQEFPFQSYEKYCDHVSKLKTPVGEIPIWASFEVFGVKIVRLYGYGHRVLDYMTPRNRDPKKVVCISFLYNHADSMFRTGTKPPPLLEPLSKQRLEKLRLGGFYTVDDHGRNQQLMD